MYYPKFYYELNYIKLFLYNGKSWTCRYYKYTLDGLRKDVPKAFNHVKPFTILGHYKSCLKKMDLYREKVVNGTDE